MNREIKLAKQLYSQNLLEKCMNSPADLWKNIRSILGTKSNAEVPSISPDSFVAAFSDKLSRALSLLSDRGFNAQVSITHMSSSPSNITKLRHFQSISVCDTAKLLGQLKKSNYPLDPFSFRLQSVAQ